MLHTLPAHTHTHVPHKTRAPWDIGEIRPRQYLDWLCLPPIVLAVLMSLCLPCVHKACLVDVCVFACMYSIAKCICVVQRGFKGLCVHNWECAGVQRFVSLCLFIYISVLFAMNYSPLPPAVQILGHKSPEWVGTWPGFGWCPLAILASDWLQPNTSQTRFHQTKMDLCAARTTPCSVHFFSFLPLSCFPYIHIQYRGLIF